MEDIKEFLRTLFYGEMCENGVRGEIIYNPGGKAYCHCKHCKGYPAFTKTPVRN